MTTTFSLTKILDSLLLMHLVREGPLHGYALTSSIEEKSGWKPSQTAVYNALKNLEKDDIVTAEEKIESGRVQKIYSISKKGRKYFEETHKQMREYMMRDLFNLFSFIQMVSDSENLDESEALQQKFQATFEDLRDIASLTLVLLKEAPKDVREIIKKTRSSLQKVVEKYDIDISNIRKICEKE